VKVIINNFASKVMFIIFLSLLAGCSNQSTVSPEEKVESSETINGTAEFLNSWSSKDQELAKIAYESLTPDFDDFTKEYYLNDENNKFKPLLGKDSQYFQFLLYKEKNNSYAPKVFVIYLAKDWLFQKSIYFKIGEEVIEIFPTQSPQTEVQDAGYVSEIFDVDLGDKDVEFLSKVFQNGNLEIRVQGTNSYEETKLSELELESLKRILLAYKYVKKNNL
jgi:hypothetical protein